jgi:hypothetical protein
MLSQVFAVILFLQVQYYRQQKVINEITLTTQLEKLQLIWKSWQPERKKQKQQITNGAH